MSPFPVIASAEEEALGRQQRSTQESPDRPLPERATQTVLAPRGRNWLHDAMLEMSDTRPAKRTWEFVAAFAVEALVIVVLILMPLIYTQAIDLKAFTATYLVAPPPPPPPPPPPAQGLVRVATRRVFTQAGRLIAPTAIPQQIAMLKEETLPPDVGGAGMEGGVPGGVPGGQVGGVLGGILQDNVKNFQPIAPPTAPRKPVRVGGQIKPPLAVFNPAPVYPVLARQAKVQGDVLINAIIDAQGSVVEMRVVSGHALLIHSALEAVSKWRYQPTILNGEPVAVELIVTVHFRLS
jgi:protein TonB